MNLRRKVGLSRIGIVSLAVLSALTIPSRAGGQAPAAAKANGTTQGADWTMALQADATVQIFYKGVQVVSCSHVYWGPKGWTWSGSNFNMQTRANGQSSIVGTIPGLRVKVNGRATWASADRLVMDFEFQAAENLSELIGGGLHWSLKLDSPSLGGKIPDPVLLPDHSGWTWPTGPEQALTVRFEPAIAKVYLEKNQKSEIRTFYFADYLKAGKSRVRMTIQLPEGGRRVPTMSERYGPTDTKRWFRGALAWNASPVDLSFLNRDDKPAGGRGFIRAEGDQFVRGDGTPIRFWGANIVANTLFSTPRQNAVAQAHRMAQLGYNLMRVHHHDADFVNPNIFDPRFKDSRHLNAASLESLDWWIKCLKDEGIYIWLDMYVARLVRPGDGITLGRDEVMGSVFKGYSYYNGQLQDLMKEFQHNYLNHLNPYTGLRYKDDPAVMGVLISNEDDLTVHGGSMMLPDFKRFVHNAIWDKDYKAFARLHGLSEREVYQTWMPGASKLYLNDAEHRFNEIMIGDLRSLGVKVPIATTNFWGVNPISSLPSLTDGDVIDVHSYGKSEAMDGNPRFQANYISTIAGGQVHGKPLSITEWNVEYPQVDRFTAPLYVASIAALQGWDAPMLFTYSMSPLKASDIHPETWSTFHDPALSGVMPAAALAYRQGHVSPARTTYCLMLEAGQFFGRVVNAETSPTIRTLAEQSKLTIGLPRSKELPWLKPTRPSEGSVIITDPDHDYIPEGQSYVRSDTDELTRDWERGIQTIDTPKTQSVSGWIGGKSLKTRDATFATSTKKAVIALSSADSRPLNTSRFIMITAVARVVPSPGNQMPFLSEPVLTTISLRTQNAGMTLLALDMRGHVVGSSNPQREGDVLTFRLPFGGGTHWYVLRSTEPADSRKASVKSE